MPRSLKEEEQESPVPIMKEKGDHKTVKDKKDHHHHHKDKTHTSRGSPQGPSSWRRTRERREYESRACGLHGSPEDFLTQGYLAFDLFQ
uniref:Uncharacterized protein n=1 Tax=Magallana gigas TaxID=29159 RepID=A0A8W8JG07_MAGGI